MADISRRATIAPIGTAGVIDTAQAATAGGIDRATYESYIAAFNAQDIPGFTRFYAPDAVFSLGARDMRGRQAIIDWYHLAWSRLRDHCTVRRFIADPTGVAAELDLRSERAPLNGSC